MNEARNQKRRKRKNIDMPGRVRWGGTYGIANKKRGAAGHGNEPLWTGNGNGKTAG